MNLMDVWWMNTTGSTPDWKALAQMSPHDFLWVQFLNQLSQTCSFSGLRDEASPERRYFIVTIC